MNLRPFHRWKSFWFGIFITASLCWGWERSIRFEDALFLGSPRSPGFIVISNSEGELSTTFIKAGAQISLICYSPVIGSEFTKFSVWKNPHGRPIFSVPIAAHGDGTGYWWRIAIAHWFLILLFAIIWITWMVRRARRFKRLAAEFELGSAGSQPAP
jgi:hypothetical protein